MSNKFYLFAFVSLVSSHSSAKYIDSDTPNIIIILADDMGYSELGCYGGDNNTPNLDRLAFDGLRFSRFCNSAMSVCSRYSLLTGKWWPSATRDFQNIITLPEVLHENGYNTGIIGKWHLKGTPMQKGFDHFFGFLGGFSNHFKGSKDYRLDNEVFSDFGENYYSTDAFTSKAVDFIKESVDKKSPFFLYLSYQAPHNPLQAPADDINKKVGKFMDGWSAIRERRYKKQQELGIFPDNLSLPDYPDNLPDWDSLNGKQKRLEDLRMSVYSAMIERMDKGVGEVMQALEKYNVAENTIILFVSDNGADPFSNTDDAMLRQGKLPGDIESNWQLGMGMAYASVTPWRLYKISQHAGGVTTGGILWSKDLIKKKNRGKIVSAPVHFVDVMPTILDLLDLKSPDGVSGESFLPLVEKSSWNREKPMFFQFMDNRAIRTSKWTMVEVDGNGWELYDVKKDPFEVNNLAGERPDVVASLSKEWNNWWLLENGGKEYKPRSTKNNIHYIPQGDRGSGKIYSPREIINKE